MLRFYRGIAAFFALLLSSIPVFAEPAPGDEADLNPAVVDSSDLLVNRSYFSMAPDHAGTYFELDAGSVNRDWRNFGSNTLFTPSVSTDLDHEQKGFTLGGILGFQYSQFFSLETGLFSLPKTSATNSSLSVANEKSWMLYLAAKFSAPLFTGFYWFGKIGYAYTHNQLQNAEGTGDGNTQAVEGGEGKSRYMAFIPATGFQYYLTPKLSVVAQWMYLPGYYHTPALNYTVPDAYFYTLGINYKYLI